MEMGSLVKPQNQQRIFK